MAMSANLRQSKRAWTWCPMCLMPAQHGKCSAQQAGVPQLDHHFCMPPRRSVVILGDDRVCHFRTAIMSPDKKGNMFCVRSDTSGPSHGNGEIQRKRGPGRPLGSTNKMRGVSDAQKPRFGMKKGRGRGRGMKSVSESSHFPFGLKKGRGVKGVSGLSKFPFGLKKKGRGRGVKSQSKPSKTPGGLQEGNGIIVGSASTEVTIGIKRGRGRPRKSEMSLENGILKHDDRDMPLKKTRGRPRKKLKLEENSFETQKHVRIVPLKTEDHNNQGATGSKLHRRKKHPSDTGASTSNTQPLQINQDIHPSGSSIHSTWTREGAVSEELLPPLRETQGSQYPDWGTEPPQMTWVHGEVMDSSDSNTVTHWVVEEPQAPRPPIYTEEPLIEQSEFREDLLRGLADFRYQLTREIAAARGEMREGAELVRSAIDGVAAEIRRLGLLLQPLVTALTSGNVQRPQQNTPPLGTMLRPPQDTPPDDPPAVPQQTTQSTNPINLPQQSSFPLTHHSQLGTSPGNTQNTSPCIERPPKSQSPPQQEAVCPQSRVLDCPSPDNNNLCQPRDTLSEESPDHPQTTAVDTKPPSPPQHEMSPSHSEQDPSAVPDCPSPVPSNLCQAEDTAPVLLADALEIEASSTLECLPAATPTTLSHQSSCNSPVVPAEEPTVLSLDAGTVETFCIVSQSSEMLSDSSVLSQCAATLSQDCIQMSQTPTLMSEDSVPISQATPTSPRAGTAPQQSEKDVALMISQDSESPVSLTDFPSVRSSEMDIDYPPC
ncbi:uncharacterized protein RCH25_043501 [Pelodytes ibericus]